MNMYKCAIYHQCVDHIRS